MKAWVRRHGGAIYLTCLVLAGTGASYYLAIHNAASVTQLCQAGNEARAQQVQLWQFVVHISRTPPHQTPAQAAQRARTVRAFEAYLHRVLAPRDCHAITR